MPGIRLQRNFVATGLECQVQNHPWQRHWTVLLTCQYGIIQILYWRTCLSNHMRETMCVWKNTQWLCKPSCIVMVVSVAGIIIALVPSSRSAIARTCHITQPARQQNMTIFDLGICWLHRHTLTALPVNGNIENFRSGNLSNISKWISGTFSLMLSFNLKYRLTWQVWIW